MAKHDGEIIDSVKGYDIIDCKVCGFYHVYPIPTKQDNFYAHSFYENRPNAVNNYNHDLKWWKMHYNRRLDWIEKILPGTGKMLDIGCGLGHFALEAKRRGWTVQGVDPSIKAARDAHKNGLDVFRGTVSDTTYSQFKGQDVVCLVNVLEHVADPIKLLCHAVLMIRPGGLLFVVTPNDYNSLQMYAHTHLGLDKWWINPPQHINYFDSQMIEKTIKSIGFNIHSTSATFPIELFLLAGVNYVGNNEKGRQSHEYRMKAEMNIQNAGLWDIADRLYSFVQSEGWGRETEVLAKR